MAVPLPEGFPGPWMEIRRRVGRRLPDLKWTPPENLHLTLKFLGEVAEAPAEDARRALRESLAPVPPFWAALEGVGAFPTPARPRVVWVGIGEGRAALEALAERVETALEKAGFPREERPYQAHLTLARARSPRPVKDTAFWKEWEGRSFGRFHVEDVRLMQSHLSPEGATYSTVERYGLIKA